MWKRVSKPGIALAMSSMVTVMFLLWRCLVFDEAHFRQDMPGAAPEWILLKLLYAPLALSWWFVPHDIQRWLEPYEQILLAGLLWYWVGRIGEAWVRNEASLHCKRRVFRWIVNLALVSMSAFLSWVCFEILTSSYGVWSPWSALSLLVWVLACAAVAFRDVRALLRQ